MPKPLPRAGQVDWCADYRVRYDIDRNLGTWQRFDGIDWVPVAYADVPDDIHATRFKRDGWKFYTLRRRGYRLGEDGHKRYFEA